ncbi:MFS general substrate transporter [Annulohypoxylon maeteangense]|uniref:MFS general substrate transporter n=1 Tax=Annulohypoxylon maeteangense TaxID=1927788 RepID=UPI002007BD40|nr:MFS general substrate transporter [Annulohypoxylon maeteangense]KAI0881358.1 MFS general substrate transporter [Annulohypoxylon maeteangense]
MSLHALIHHELTPGTSSLAGPSAISPENVISRVSEEKVDRTIYNVELQTPQPPIPSPEEIQRVFDVAPLNVTNKRRRLAITTLIVACNLMQMICNMMGVAGGLIVSKRLGVSGVHANWVGASYPLTQGTFVLISGRFGAVYGHKNMLLVGSLILIVFTLVCGFSNNFVAFNVMRAMSGIGGAFIMPNAVAMIGITNPPGFARNLSLAFFGASAPIGGWLGALVTGGFLESTPFAWLFVFIATMSLIVTVALWALLPREVPVDPKGKIDWIGSFLALGGLIVFNVVWNQAPAVGWSSPMVIATLIVSVSLFVGYYIWEHYFASDPIMPLSIFKAPSFTPLIFVVLLNFMAAGSLFWYTVLWLQEIRHWTPMQFAVGWTPFGLGGAAATFLAAYLIPRVPAQWILAMGSSCMLVASILIATMPEQQTYWSQVFPSTIMSALSPDLTYTAAQIIASNSVSRKQQGVAGSLIGSLLLYGTSLGLGFASTVEAEVGKGRDKVVGYRGALYFTVALCAASLILDICFVRLVQDNREGWEDPADADPADEVIAPVATGTELRELQPHLEQR